MESGLGCPLYPVADMLPWLNVELLSLQVMNSIQVILQKFCGSEMEKAFSDID